MRLLVIPFLVLAGCTNTSLIDKLALEPNENGFIKVTARIDINNNPFATTWADITYCEYGNNWPEDVEKPEC